MQVEKVLNVIKKLAEEIITLEAVDRLRNYFVIKSLLDELRDEGNIRQIPINMFNEYTRNLLGHCRILAGLYTNDGHDDQQHLRWIYAEIDKLRSAHCFNIKFSSLNI